MSRAKLPAVFRNHVPGRNVTTDTLHIMKTAAPDYVVSGVYRMIDDFTYGDISEILRNRPLYESEFGRTPTTRFAKYGIDRTDEAIMALDMIDAMRNNVKAQPAPIRYEELIHS